MSNNNSTRERYLRLKVLAHEAQMHIEYLAPYLDRQARESGDVRGIQINARACATDIRQTLQTFDAMDEADAKARAGKGV